MIVTWQMKKIIFVMAWFDGKLRKNELPCFTKMEQWGAVLGLQGELGLLQMGFRYQAWLFLGINVLWSGLHRDLFS